MSETLPKKKILLLGGSAAQVVAIERAKQLGYHTVVCDYLPDNPGQYIADTFHLVSTTDKEAILAIARSEKIDGIVAYSSDPAAPTAAYVANAMGLPGNDYEVVRHFCEKQLFREFLNANGFSIPQSVKVDVSEITNVDLSSMDFPVIVKPTDSSGSKGVTVLTHPDGLHAALEYAAKYSRNRVLIIEEFIQRDHPYVIEAEIFAIGGNVVSWGLINSVRDEKSNPLLPAAYTYPLELPESRINLVKQEVSKLVRTSGNMSGAFNIEMIIDKNDRLFFLDAGPRNGGNMLPEFISMISGKDIVSATIKNAMGDIEGLDVELDGKSGGYWGLGVFHSNKKGSFEKMEYSPLAKKRLRREEIQKMGGDEIRPFERCNDLVGLGFFQFETLEEMHRVMLHPYESMKVVLG